MGSTEILIQPMAAEDIAEVYSVQIDAYANHPEWFEPVKLSHPCFFRYSFTAIYYEKLVLCIYIYLFI